MVAINDDLTPAKGIVPALRLQSEDEKALHAHAVQTRKEIREWDKTTEAAFPADEAKVPSSTDVSLTDRVNDAKPLHIPIEQTELIAHRLFFRGHLNIQGSVFGGEILRWMELHAVHCGRVFSGNKRVVCLGMHSVEFQRPIFHTDWTHVRCHVVFVRNTTMEVDAEVIVQRGDEQIVTNSASFVLASLDEIGKCRIIPIGLDMKGSNWDWRRKHLMAKARYAKIKRTIGELL